MKIIFLYILIVGMNHPIFSQVLTHQKTAISFEIDTRFGKANGEFKKVSLEVIDPKAKKAKVEIDISSIDTGNSLRDNHLRNEDFFDVPNFPKASFEVLNVKENSPNSLILTGKLTIKNIEKTYEIPVTLSEDSQTAQYSGSVGINRKEFQINYDSMINPIKDLAKVQFTVTFEKKGK
jgi:polyisoprenoid-binding protein YceI